MPVNVIGTLKPKNNGKFPVAEAVDIKVTDNLRLDEALENKADLSTVNFALAGKVNATDFSTSTANLQGQINQIVISSSAESVVAPEVAAARVDADGITYQTLKARLDNDHNNVLNRITNIETNIGTINIQSLSTFIRGRLTSGAIYTDLNYRVVSQDIMHTNVALKFTISSGFKFSLNKYDSEGNYITGSDSGWQTELTLDANDYFRIMIARQTEDTTEIADISFFVGQVSSERDITVSAELDEARVSDNTVYSSLAERLNADKSSIVSDIDSIKEQLDIITMYDLSDYSRGRITAGIIYTDFKNRVVSVDIIHPEKPLKFTVLDPENFKMSVQKFDSEGNYITGSDSGWQEEIMINAGEYFRLMIARQVEIPSEIADIDYFVSQINCEIQKAPSSDVETLYKFLKIGNIEVSFSDGELDDEGEVTESTTWVTSSEIACEHNDVYEINLIQNSSAFDVIVCLYDSNSQIISYKRTTSATSDFGILCDASNVASVRFSISKTSMSRLINIQRVSPCKPSGFSNSRCKTICHTGYLTGNYPRNSAEGFLEACKSDVYGVETDLQVTSDGVIICLHDPYLDDLTDGTGLVSDKTYAEISQLHLVHDGVVTEYRICTFETFLKYCKVYGKIPFIELKPDTAQYGGANVSIVYNYDEIVKEIRKYNLEKYAVIISFDYKKLNSIREKSDYLCCCFLAFASGYINPQALVGKYKFARNLNSGISIAQESQDVNESSIRAYQTCGLSFNSWTSYPANRTYAIAQRDMGIDTITAEKIADVFLLD